MAKVNKAVLREFQKVNGLFEMGRAEGAERQQWRNCRWYCEPAAVAHEGTMQPKWWTEAPIVGEGKMLCIKVTSIPRNSYNCKVNVKYLMQQEPDHVAKLFSIQCNFLLELKHFIPLFCHLAKGEKN